MNELEQNQQTNSPTPVPEGVKQTVPSNPFAIKLVAWGCFIYPAFVLLPLFYIFLKYVKTFDQLVAFIVGGLYWGFTIIIAIWVVFLLVTGFISIVLGRALLKKEKYAYVSILFISLFLIAIQAIAVYVTGAFKVESFSLLSLWCVFVTLILLFYRKLY